MSGIECIACRKINAAGDRFCAGCGSSLDLKLCAACDAVNNPVADRCHSCNEPLASDAVPTLSVEADAPRSYPVPHRPMYDAGEPRRSRVARVAKTTLLVVLPLAAIAVWAYEFHARRLPTSASAMPAAAVAPTASVQPPAQAPAQAPATAPKAAAVAASLEPKRSARPVSAPAPRIDTAAPAAAGDSAAPRRGVTHTRAGAPAVPSMANDKELAPTSVPAAAGTAEPPTALAPGKVTHTRATAMPEVPAAAPGCTPPEAVLGLCTMKTHKGGS